MRFQVKPRQAFFSFFPGRRGPSTPPASCLLLRPCLFFLSIFSPPPPSPHPIVGQGGGGEKMLLLVVAHAFASARWWNSLLSAGVVAVRGNALTTVYPCGTGQGPNTIYRVRPWRAARPSQSPPIEPTVTWQASPGGITAALPTWLVHPCRLRLRVWLLFISRLLPLTFADSVGLDYLSVGASTTSVVAAAPAWA